MDNKKIVIGIPCYNEELTIGMVIDDCKKEFPESEVLVVDNNSRDATAQKAAEAGATVVSEKRQGKGYAVQRIFNEFNGEILVLIDGDGTYSIAEAKKMVIFISNGEAEMVVGNRIHEGNSKTFSKSHWWGNKFLTTALNFLFQVRFCDMESGLRAIDHSFVKSSALLAGGFGIEPELTIQALERGMRIMEVPISLDSRPNGSHSKLNAIRDGSIVLYTMISLFRDYKPLQFFSSLAGICMAIGFSLGWYSVRDYVASGIVYHIPALVVSGFFVLASFISFIAGLILSSIKRRHDELLVILRRNYR
jgi:glycosyltransferase involved in cell wall biosynthesis